MRTATSPTDLDKEALTEQVRDMREKSNRATAEQSRYNGWANRDTWAVNLWMSNDEESQLYWSEAAAGALRNPKRTCDEWNHAEAAVFALEDRLREEHEEGIPWESTVYSDLLGSALASVNWREIAEHWIEAAIYALD